MKQKFKKIMIGILCMEALGVLIEIGDFLTESVFFDNTLERGEAEEGPRMEEMKVQWGSEEEKIEVQVSPQELPEKQRQELFRAAKEEIDDTFPGKNDSLDQIRSSVVVKDSYQGGIVDAEWKFDNYEFIDPDGELDTKNLTDDGSMVTATVLLTYLDHEELYRFSFCVFPPKPGSRAYVLAGIRDAVMQADSASAGTSAVALPKKIGHTPLVWKKVSSHRGLQICLLGMLTLVAVVFGNVQQQRIDRERLHRDKLLDYPEIVSRLSLLLGSGIGLKGSMQRISSQYETWKKEHPGLVRAGFEEVLRTFHEMEAGVGEMEALAHFGRHSGLREYRKLSLLLEQNLRKGTRELNAILEGEEQEAFTLRKQLAKRRGEEASTQLLVPMVGMLFLVIVILITPALMAVQ